MTDLLDPKTRTLDDKQAILDICARADDGTLVNVEIQLFNRYDIEKRTLFYWAKLYTSQLSEGEQYRKLRRTVAINILEREQWEVLAMQELALKKAMTTLEILSQSEEARWRYEARQKILCDQASMLEGAREEGRTEGLQQGELKKAEEVARNLLARGMDADTVAEVTGLPPERVRAWTNEAR